MKRGAIAVLSAGLMVLSAHTEEYPTYKGLQCLGWIKPQAQSVAEGESEGESLTVNQSLTDGELAELKRASSAADAAFDYQRALERKIIVKHNPDVTVDQGWMFSDKCGGSIMIRADEFHITHFIPSNPKYPGQSIGIIKPHNGVTNAECRAYFADMRKRAVPVKYGSDASE